MTNLNQLLGLAARAFLNRDQTLLLLESKKGVVYAINEKHGGYQWSLPITPNHQSGSAIGGTGDHWDSVSIEQMLKTLESGERNIPHFFTPKQRESVHFVTIDEHVAKYDNILGYWELNIPVWLDRERVNKVRDEKGPCIEVSEAFVDEMRDCVPPQTMKYTGLYHIMQVGEPASHDALGPLYETFMLMTEEAVSSDLADSRMEVNKWYFTGLNHAYKAAKV